MDARRVYVPMTNVLQVTAVHPQLHSKVGQPHPRSQTTADHTNIEFEFENAGEEVIALIKSQNIVYQLANTQ
jgi:hypothetical protein